MSEERIESYKQFSNQLEYPMVIFEAESGKVLHVNYEASVMFGKQVERVFLEPRNVRVYEEFWERLHVQKSLLWHRIRLVADDMEFAVSGFVNEMEHEGKRVYSLLFETQMQLGGLVLERVLSQAKMVSVYESVQEDSSYKIEYISQNINIFGYTSTQFYGGNMEVLSLVCEEDRRALQQAVKRGRDEHANDIKVECRIVTETRELAPVRIHIRYVYNECNNLNGLELLIYDLRDEIYHKKANDYLNHAISKMKNLVLVKTYRRNERRLEYISPNAEMFGMNEKALQNGLKLTEDYIHPADRETVLDNIYQAVENDVTEFSQTYRQVRDDGTLIWVLNEFTVERKNEEEALISFLLTDVTEQKMIEQKLAQVQEELKEEDVPMERQGLPTLEINDKELVDQLQGMKELLNGNASYYNTVFDTSGNQIGAPVGPKERMGVLYDLFERAQFKDAFNDVSMRVREQRIPIQTSFTLDGQLVQMIFAPIFMRDIVRAFWVLIDFQQQEISSLAMIAGGQTKLANAVGKSLFIEKLIRKEENLHKLSSVRLKREQESNQLVTELLSDLLSKDANHFSKICQKIAMHFKVSNVGIYLENKETRNVEKYYAWSKSNSEAAFFNRMELKDDLYQSLMNVFKEKAAYVIDENNGVVAYKQVLQTAGVDAMMLCPLWIGDEIKGYLVLADEVAGHRFEERDYKTCNMVALVLGELLLGRELQGQERLSLEKTVSVYDHLKEAIYVKDNQTGKIIFSNRVMNALFAKDLTGMDSKEIVYNRMEQYQQLDSIRKRYITNKKVVKWQTYLKELNRVMNIKEIQLLEDSDGYSMVVIREADS